MNVEDVCDPGHDRRGDASGYGIDCKKRSDLNQAVPSFLLRGGGGEKMKERKMCLRVWSFWWVVVLR